MNNADLAKATSAKTNLPAKDSAAVLDAALEIIVATIKGGEEVRLANFGIFGVSDTAAKTGKNPQTGATIEIPAGKRARFKPSKKLKDAIQA